MSDGPPVKRKRNRRNRKKPELDLDSSSSSNAEEEVSRVSVEPLDATKESDESSSESSAIFSEEEVSTSPAKKTKARAVDATSDAASVAATEEVPHLRPVRQRSISPPHFGFDPPSRTPGKPVLWGKVPGDETETDSTLSHHPEYAAFRQFYIDKLVERFGNDLAALQKDVTTEDRLTMLIKSLAGGADLFMASSEPNGQRDVVLQAMAAQVKRQESAAANGHAGNADDAEMDG